MHIDERKSNLTFLVEISQWIFKVFTKTDHKGKEPHSFDITTFHRKTTKNLLLYSLAMKHKHFI